MPLQYDPSFLFSTSGSALGNTILTHNPVAGSSVGFTVDFSNIIGGNVQILVQPSGAASVNAVNGVQIQSFSTSDNVWYDTIPYGVSYVLPTVAASVQRSSFTLDTGKYQIVLTNIDPSNNIAVMATTGLLT